MKTTTEQLEAARKLDTELFGRSFPDNVELIAAFLAYRDQERDRVIAELRGALAPFSGCASYACAHLVKKRDGGHSIGCPICAELLNAYKRAEKAEALLTDILSRKGKDFAGMLKKITDLEALNASVAAEAVRPWREAVEKMRRPALDVMYLLHPPATPSEPGVTEDKKARL